MRKAMLPVFIYRGHSALAVRLYASLARMGVTFHGGGGLAASRIWREHSMEARRSSVGMRISYGTVKLGLA
ncbi:hypothetical protein EDD17DRAFT_1526713 [Pisolithus thermaeus]|nr:hypothetical protein EDD17DRAFT_1526713 [Pisolithus thermaeus]